MADSALPFSAAGIFTVVTSALAFTMSMCVIVIRAHSGGLLDSHIITINAACALGALLGFWRVGWPESCGPALHLGAALTSCLILVPVLFGWRVGRIVAAPHSAASAKEEAGFIVATTVIGGLGAGMFSRQTEIRNCLFRFPSPLLTLWFSSTVVVGLAFLSCLYYDALKTLRNLVLSPRDPSQSDVRRQILAYLLLYTAAWISYPILSIVSLFGPDIEFAANVLQNFVHPVCLFAHPFVYGWNKHLRRSTRRHGVIPRVVQTHSDNFPVVRKGGAPAPPLTINIEAAPDATETPPTSTPVTAPLPRDTPAALSHTPRSPRISPTTSPVRPINVWPLKFALPPPARG